MSNRRTKRTKLKKAERFNAGLMSKTEIVETGGDPNLGKAAQFYLVKWHQGDGVARHDPPYCIVLAYDAMEATSLARLRNPERIFSDVFPYEPKWPDHFTHKSGSKMWPPLNSNDSPFDEFTCKHCGGKLSVQMYGAFPIGQGPEVGLKLKTDSHLRRCSGLGR